jgi:hypothetical protein
VPGILADNDVQRHVERLCQIFESSGWRDIWEALGYTVHTFESLGLARDAPDRVVWQECQRREVVLITGNRNDDGPDSLQSTIRTQNGPDKLPIITLANPIRVLRDKTYAYSVAEQALDYLMNIESYRGAGRLYLPR